MACVWIEGFESHIQQSQMSRKYGSFSGSWTPKSGRVFGAAGGAASVVAVTPPVGSGNTCVVGYGFTYPSHLSNPNLNTTGWYVESGPNEQVHVEHESTLGLGFRWSLQVGTTTIYTSPYYDFGVWHYFEWKFTVRTGTNGAWEFRHNGVAVNSGTSLDLANTGVDGWDTFAWRTVSNYSNSLIYDDFYLCDGTGSKNNDFLGPSVVEKVEVDTEGTTIEWTPDNGTDNSNNVDDVGTSAPDDSGAGGFNYSDTNTNKDTFVMTDLTQITGTIHAVQLGVQLAMGAAGTRTVKTVYRDPDTTEADGDSHVVDSTTYDEFTQVFDDNPASAAAWDVTDIDGGEFGVEVVS